MVTSQLLYYDFSFFRERKFINRANDHLQATSQRFCDEAALTAACFATLEEDVREHDQREIRTHDRRLLTAAVDVRQIRVKIDAECALRSVEDNDILDSVMETQKLLQQTVAIYSSYIIDGLHLT